MMVSFTLISIGLLLWAMVAFDAWQWCLWPNGEFTHCSVGQ